MFLKLAMNWWNQWSEKCIFFVDPEGDQIAFSTDEELVEALGFVEDGIFRITLKGKGKHQL